MTPPSRRATPAEKAPQTVFSRRLGLFVDKLKADAQGRPAFALIFSGEERHLQVFAPDPTFYYLTGVESPNAALLVCVSPVRDSVSLLLPMTDPAKERWTGKVLSAGHLTKDCRPDELRTEAAWASGRPADGIGVMQQWEEQLVRPLRDAEAVYLNFPDDMPIGQTGWSQGVADKLRTSHPHLSIRHAGRLASDLRRVKDARELTLMKKAMAVTDEAHRAVLAHLRPGMTEYQIQALVEYVFKFLGAQHTAFPTIIGSGPWSCTLHYDRNSRTTKRRDVVVCDFGCRKDLYCADETRTYPVSGKFTKRQRKVYDVVLAAQEAALAAARPGKLVKDVHQAATDVIGKAGFAQYFIHGTSHYLGLDAHDAGSYDLPLEPGVVITIEPGIYIAQEELGVRIEDDVLITAKGAERMTHAPSDPGEIEKLMAKPRRTIVV